MLLLVAAVGVLSACKGGAMTPWRLQQDADSLASIAADGELLAAETAKGESTGPFTTVHARELRQEADQLADVVASTEPDPGLARPTAQLATTARAAARVLRRLEEHPGDEDVAARVGDRLGAIADRAEQIGKQA